jgi:threonine-phosphate decarboxylase
MEVRHGGVEYLNRSLFPGGGGEARLLDFSVNINPLGLPESAAEAARAAIGSARRGGYPDPFCRRLREALSARLSVPASNIVCGNGAGDLIYRIVRRLTPRKALVTAPAFSDYEKALLEASSGIVHHELEKPNFLLDGRILEKINGDIQLVFLCSPNNPTGLTIDRDLLAKIVRKCEECRVTLVVDECFNEFLDEPEVHTALPYLAEAPRLLILRAFTKIYAMAGLRLGYCVTGGEKRASALADTGQAWPVSVPAQAAGIAVLGDKDYYDRSRALVKTERARMKTEFKKLGFESTCGEANFIFFRVTPASGFDNGSFFASLLKRGILIRRCDNYRGLDDSYYRAAILTHDENTALLEALAELKNKR